MKYRIADIDDLDRICEIRKRQLIDEGISPDTDIDEQLKRFFTDALQGDDFIEYFLEEDDEIIATAAIILIPFPPSFSNPSGIRAYITNMYTAPAYRGQGIAFDLLALLIEEAKKRNVRKAFLGASKMGRSVYARFGFRETGEWMEMDL